MGYVRTLGEGEEPAVTKEQNALKRVREGVRETLIKQDRYEILSR